MSNIIPFPAPREPFDEESFEDRGYEGPVPEIDPNATLYTLTEVSYLLNLPCEVTEENLVDGTIPGSQIGGGWLISRKRLEAWLNGLPREGGAW